MNKKNSLRRYRQHLKLTKQDLLKKQKHICRILSERKEKLQTTIKELTDLSLKIEESESLNYQRSLKERSSYFLQANTCCNKVLKLETQKLEETKTEQTQALKQAHERLDANRVEILAIKHRLSQIDHLLANQEKRAYVSDLANEEDRQSDLTSVTSTSQKQA